MELLLPIRHPPSRYSWSSPVKVLSVIEGKKQVYLEGNCSIAIEKLIFVTAIKFVMTTVEFL